MASGNEIVDPACGLEAHLALTPGQPVSLRASAEDRGGLATVLGCKSGEFFIVKPSPAQSVKNGFEPDLPILIGLEIEGVLYQFESLVLNYLKHPTPVLFLSYPKSVETRVLRRYPRIKCLVPTVIEGRGVFCNGHLRDISRGGCRVVTSLREAGIDGAFSKGDEIDIRLPMDDLRSHTLPVQVRSTNREDGLLNLGLAFRSRSEASPTVTRFINHLTRMEALNEEASKESAKAPPPAFVRAQSMQDATASVGDASQVSIKSQEAIEIQFTGNHLFDQSMILGVDGTDTVIAEMPISSGLKNCPKSGMGLRARFEDHGSHYGFRTFVTKFITKPRPLVFFAYPKKIEILMRRKHPRVQCQLPARLENEHVRMTGYITDISLGGCRVMANLDDGEFIFNIMTGDKLVLTLSMAGLKAASLRTQVKSFTLRGNTVTMGLVFGLDKQLAHSMSEFIIRLEAAAQ